MKKNLFAFLAFTIVASFAVSQSTPDWSSEIKNTEKQLRPIQASNPEEPQKMLAETTFSFGISTPVAGVSLVPRVRFQWTKSENQKIK